MTLSNLDFLATGTLSLHFRNFVDLSTTSTNGLLVHLLEGIRIQVVHDDLCTILLKLAEGIGAQTANHVDH